MSAWLVLVALCLLGIVGIALWALTVLGRFDRSTDDNLEGAAQRQRVGSTTGDCLPRSMDW